MKNKKTLKLIALITSLQYTLSIKAELMQLNTDKIKAAQQELVRSQYARDKFIIGATCAMTVGIGGVIYKLLFSNPEINPDFQMFMNRYETLPEDQKQNIKNIFQIKPEENNLDTSITKQSILQSFINSMKVGAKNVLHYVKIGTPILAMEVGRSILWSKLTELLNYSLPNAAKFSDKIFSNRTLTWFIDHKTSLICNIKSFTKAIDSIGQSEFYKEDLEINYNMLVAQIEKIIGFMIYNTSLLKIDQIAALQKSQLIQRKTVSSLTEIYKLIKKINNEEDVIDKNNIPEEQQEFFQNNTDIIKQMSLRSTLINLISSIQDFQEIDKVLELDDNIERPVFDIINQMLNFNNLNQMQNKSFDLYDEEELSI